MIMVAMTVRESMLLMIFKVARKRNRFLYQEANSLHVNDRGNVCIKRGKNIDDYIMTQTQA